MQEHLNTLPNESITPAFIRIKIDTKTLPLPDSARIPIKVYSKKKKKKSS